MRPVIFGTLLVLPIAMFGMPAAAQSDSTSRQLIQQLLPRTSADAARGIRPVGSAPAAAAVTGVPASSAPGTTAATAPPDARARVGTAPAPSRSTTAPEGMAAASITITFPSGSAELTPAAMAALTPLGHALSSADLAAYRFRIEGHTDSVGPREANQSLSERRAAAVRNFLVERFGVGAARLDTIGRGEEDLLIQTGDEVAERRNRRVQVVNIGR